MLKMAEHVVDLYMHEVALHVDHNVEEFKPPFTEDALGGVGVGDQSSLNSEHIRALSVCLNSVDGIFETFLKLDVETVRCLPVINFVRIAYAVVVLIKMYFAAATPNSEFGKVISKDNMKVEQYLDGLVNMFSAAAAEKKSRPSHKFLMVLLMLKTWFARQREAKPAPQSGEPTILLDTPAETASDKQNPQQRSGQQQGYSTEDRGLHLLSEVATQDPDVQSRSGSVSQNLETTTDWQQPQQQSLTNYPSMTQWPMAPFGNLSTDSPFLGLDNNLVPDGLDQAMGMAIGVGPFGEYYSDEAFYGMMDPTAGASFFEGM
jgi:hypothetical protein